MLSPTLTRARGVWWNGREKAARESAEGILREANMTMQDDDQLGTVQSVWLGAENVAG